MLTVESVAALLEQLAPCRLAEDWDNVGLLVGDPQGAVERIMTCLTITPATAAEAIDERADLLVAHHPLPFRPLNRLTTGTVEGKLLLSLITARIAVYSAHTAFDSAAEGINQRLAVGLGLTDVAPLIEQTDLADDPAVGAGRRGKLAPSVTLKQLAERLKQFLAVERVQYCGEADRQVSQVGIACGSGGALLEAARLSGCDCFLTGEARFHACLEAEAAGLALLLPGHYASERFALECLSDQLAAKFPQARVWASRREKDPLAWF